MENNENKDQDPQESKSMENNENKDQESKNQSRTTLDDLQMDEFPEIGTRLRNDVFAKIQEVAQMNAENASVSAETLKHCIKMLEGQSATEMDTNSLALIGDLQYAIFHRNQNVQHLSDAYSSYLKVLVTYVGLNPHVDRSQFYFHKRFLAIKEELKKIHEQSTKDASKEDLAEDDA